METINQTERVSISGRLKDGTWSIDFISISADVPAGKDKFEYCTELSEALKAHVKSIPVEPKPIQQQQTPSAPYQQYNQQQQQQPQQQSFETKICSCGATMRKNKTGMYWNCPNQKWNEATRKFEGCKGIRVK